MGVGGQFPRLAHVRARDVDAIKQALDPDLMAHFQSALPTSLLRYYTAEGK